jgi:hypothetical protein
VTARNLSVTDTADRLGISTKWLTELSKKAVLPRTGHGCNAKHAWPQVRDAYNRYLSDKAVRDLLPNRPDAANIRKAESQARLAEIEVQKAEERLLPLELHLERLDRIAQRVRRGASFGRYVADVQQPTSTTDAAALLERMGDDLLRALQSVADELEAEDDGAGDDDDAT